MRFESFNQLIIEFTTNTAWLKRYNPLPIFHKELVPTSPTVFTSKGQISSTGPNAD